MLLRNHDPFEGLCDGTLLTCHGFDHNIIDVEISISNHLGKRVFVSRISFLLDSSKGTGFSFEQTQFPIRLSFAMKINKS